MSYSSQTKEELCRFEPDSVCCLLAELSGIVCAAGSVIYRGGGEKRLSIETENNAVARRAFRLLREVFDVQPQLVTLKRSKDAASRWASGVACPAKSRCANAAACRFCAACFWPADR